MSNRGSVSRRYFISRTAAGLAATALFSSSLDSIQLPSYKIKAVAFDAFPIFDPRPVSNLAVNLFEEKGAELNAVWKTKQFEYSWLRSLGGKYRDFWKITEDALVFAATKTGVTLSANNKKELMEQYLALPIWPDVIPALQKLKARGIRLSFLSNMTAEMLNSCIKNARIVDYFENVISTDSIKTYKPGPAAYRLAIETSKLKKEQIPFAAFAGWDVSGAKWFGYPSFWVNRLDAPTEELNAIPDGAGKGLTDLVNFIFVNS
jgi:2-haloacid dehalogenase